jgi:hypothetical protein
MQSLHPKNWWRGTSRSKTRKARRLAANYISLNGCVPFITLYLSPRKHNGPCQQCDVESFLLLALHVLFCHTTGHTWPEPSTKNVGSDGPKQSVKVKKTIKPPTRDRTTVTNSTMANLRKNVITVNGMTAAAANVVKAPARIDGPMNTRAYLVRSD